MFRRHWSGLPKDAHFPYDLKELGYFVNEVDEVRSIANPDFYFKYFLDRNERINFRQRFCMDYALQKIVHQRLEYEGLVKIPLPLGTPSTEKHIPIFAEKGLSEKSRVVIIFGECTKALGWVAGRVITGEGGIDKGSMVRVVKALHEQTSTAADAVPPGVVLANVGECWWWPEEKRALTVTSSFNVPMPSLVHAGVKTIPELNHVKGYTSPEDNVKSMFEDVLPHMLGENAVVDIVAIGDTCSVIEKYLDEKAAWDTWGKRISSMVLVDTLLQADQLANADFKEFLAKRARCYQICSDTVDLPLAPPSGNPSLFIPALGVPCYSSSEPKYAECILITALEPILNYLQRNALDPTLENDQIPVPLMPQLEGEEEGPETQELTDESWGQVAEGDKPVVEVFDPARLDHYRKQAKMWERFVKTGQAMDPALEDLERGESA
ncbi:Arb2 domain-containing protein [Emericellopsis atlantica]|uniref:Arb2 domain-containing protein n=1 Tax=Emericellopsis atlantica TaxID=2614577 RepID=A0A9P7ZU70_9HYPO|nr:Arb2 domain-containing protein [Emericellopsis atlantica]KAG9257765.1 Arb2 domain-containing protein [Emericellopsis atlantica]